MIKELHNNLWLKENFFKCPTCSRETKFSQKIDVGDIGSLTVPAIHRKTIYSCEHCKILLKLITNVPGNGIVFDDESKMFFTYFNNYGSMTPWQRRQNFGRLEEIAPGWTAEFDKRGHLMTLEIIAKLNIPKSVMDILPREFLLQEVKLKKKTKPKKKNKGRR